MGYIEVDRNGRMQVVSSSKKKHDKRTKPANDEPVYLVDEERENDLLNDIHNLKAVIAQYKEENKNLRKIAHDSEHVAKMWKTEAQEWKGKYENAAAGKSLLEERVTRRNEELRKRSDEIADLADDKKKLKERNDELVIRSNKHIDVITVLKDDVRRLKEDNVRRAVKETKLEEEIDALTRLLAKDRGIPRRRDEPSRRHPYDNDHWDNIGPLPLRDNLRARWGGRGGRDYESDQ